MAMTSQVTVSKGLLAGLGGMAAVAVVAVVFLLGRESTRTAPVAAPMATAAEPLPVTAPPLADTPASEPVFPPPGKPAPAVAPVLIPAAPAARNDPDRAAVAAYFKAVDTIQPETKGDPDGVAQQIVAGFGKGDTSSFDNLDRQAQTARTRMAGLTPPAPCAAFHQESLECMEEGLEVMRGIRKAMTAAEGSTSLGELTARATALKSRSEALKAQETALRHRYCE